MQHLKKQYTCFTTCFTFLALVTQSELIVVYTPIIRGLPIEKGLGKGAWMRES